MSKSTLSEFGVKPGTIENPNLLQFVVIAGPNFLDQVSPDGLGYQPALVVLEHPGTGQPTSETIVYIKKA